MQLDTVSAAAGPPLIVPPFSPESALLKIRAAVDGCNSRDPGVRCGQMGAGTRVPAGQSPVGVSRQPNGRAVPARVARRRGELVYGVTGMNCGSPTSEA